MSSPLTLYLLVLCFGVSLPAPSSTTTQCADAGVQSLLKRLEILEKLVRDIKGQCTPPCCANSQTGADDPSSLKSPPCPQDLEDCPGGCGGDSQGVCVDGQCQCKEGYMGDRCQLRTCPEDCNDQGRCVDGRCFCFEGYFGLNCGSKGCLNNCQNHGQCEDGVCVCDSGFLGEDCSIKTCPSNCLNRGKCENGVCVCASGFTGVDCGIRTCPRNCHNRGRCQNGVCICRTGFTGADCGSRLCPNNCQQRGHCEDGVCTCNPGFTGVDCSSKKCPNDCQNNGRCENGVCICDSGFSGVDCSSRPCPEDCNEQGQCVSGVCVCDTGFIGEDCGTRICSEECERNGRCEDGECVCDPGYTGTDCEIRTCPDDCHSRGRCDDGKCVCDSGYTGLDCGSRTCPNKCNNRGRCEDGNCICNSGFSGPDCGSKMCPKNCSGNGQCVNGKCVCDAGFVGPICGTRTCPVGCARHGRCVRGMCVCSPGYTGPDCGSRTCPKNCLNQGTCEDGTCVCDSGYTGLDCGTRTCPNDCHNQGQCEDGTCVCDDGYTGVDCELKSCPNDCYKRGQCKDGVCICDSGYTGLNCELKTCPNDCHNHGECKDGVCICDSGYTGLDCESKTCPNNCNNRGRCEDGECICDWGYTDLDCGSRTCPNDCQNHGRCDDGECICDSGYSGPDCGLRTCPSDCNNRGNCVDGLCVCISGYYGPDCGFKACLNDCNNRGLCEDGVCICDSWYTGLDCGSRSCPNNCQNRGRCDDGTCVCDAGFAGLDCSSTACPDNCYIHGRCEDGVCICRPGYTGLDCGSKACPKNCNDNGQCVNGKCVCNPGFSGPVCGARSCPRNCAGRGKCINGICVCKKGYGGVDCGEVVTEITAVTGLQVTSQEESAVTLEWDQPQSTPDSYEISFKAEKENGLIQTIIDGSLTTYRQIGLAPGEVYIVTIQPRKDQTLGPDTSINATTRIEAPHGLRVTDITTSSFLLRWDRPQNLPDRYIITLVTPSGKERKLKVPGKGDKARLTGLDEGTKYRVLLKAEKGQEQSEAVETTVNTAVVPTTVQPEVETTTQSTTPPPEVVISTAAPVTKKPQGIVAQMGALQVREVTSETVTLVWKARPGVYESFLIGYEDVTDISKPQETSVPGDQREVTLSDLSQNTRYSVSVYGVRNGKLSRPLKVEVTTDSDPDRGTSPRLSPIAVSEIQPDSFLMSWEPLDGDFDSYIIQYFPPGGPRQEITLRGDETSYRITELITKVNYTVEIRGIWGDKYSEVETVYVLTEKPLPPRMESLSLSDVQSDSLRLTWEVQGGEFDSFLLYYRDGEGKPQEIPLDRDLRTFTVSDLKPGKKYKFVVYGIEDEKRSKPVTVEAITEKLQPPRLESLSVSDIYTESVRLSWEVHSGEFDSFLLYYRDAEGKPKEVTLESELRMVEVDDLRPGKKYKFVLHGVSGGKKGKGVIVETTTAPRDKPVEPSKAPPSAPRLVDLQASEVGKDSVKLSWTVEGEVSFDWIVVQYREPEGGVREVQVQGQDINTIISGLLPSRKYKFNVYGLRGEKRSKPLSTEIETGYPEVIGPSSSVLDDLYITPRGPHAILVSWEVPDNSFDSFIVRYGLPEHVAPLNEMLTDGSARSLLISGLQPDTLYNVTLSGIQSGKEQGMLKGKGRTGPLDLEPPQNLRFDEINESSVVAKWDPPNAETTTFKVSYQLAEGGEPESVNVVGTSTSLKDLTPGAQYEVTVVSVRGFEESQPLSGYVTTGGGGPRALRVFDVSEVSALLRWEPPQGHVDKYIVIYKAENVPAITMDVPGDRTELPLSSLYPHTEYFASVQSVRESETSKPTSTSFTTSANTARDLSASQITARSALLTWKAPPTIPDGYLLIYQTPDGRMKEISLPHNLTNYTMSQLDPLTQYRVQLHSIHGGTKSAPISTSFTTVRLRYPFPRDCWEQRMNGEVHNGIFTIHLEGEREETMMVYCDMETDGGGWIVFQRRMDGSTDFYRDWKSYKMGFGNLTSEFWLGNIALHKLSSSAPSELRVDLRAGDEAAYAVYDDFIVESEDRHFRLRLGAYKGNAGDSLSYHNNMIFSTRDRDAQKRILPCSVSYHGAWWYRNCHFTNLNGLYNNNKDHQGMNWYTWKGFEFSIPFTEMKMRPRGGGNRNRL
ncbi:tenascin-X isoform X5 [Pelobates cultripes]|uniref:Tenascin-X isoform X5 n=2 Tax=Pelobates cultripes TaxID=61616 RepID=A0AAD1T3F5_PELCU|nr:tenascin-X isoform X5 [Pelobates cultripes]